MNHDHGPNSNQQEISSVSVEPSTYPSIFIASKEGNTDWLLELLEKGIDIHQTTSNGYTPLLYACKYGQFSAVQILHNHGGLLETVTFTNKTALMLAVISGNLKLVHYVCQVGMLDLESVDIQNRKALHFAVKYGHHIVAEYLIQSGSDVDPRDQLNSTPLIYCLRFKQPKWLMVLLNSGADIDAIDNSGKSALHHCANKSSSEFTTMLKLLLRNGASYNIRDYKHQLPLDIALKKPGAISYYLTVISKTPMFIQKIPVTCLEIYQRINTI
eukprot:TRINITY_DN4881_c0_g3_i2.p1 TRINITY_DN4881_c0_g3~~TRINITY_DN4881_c0_g3_i2.p1  ORF type:complete len:271 (+),score=36.53 TRINITY_DN4881_c0_g3_i2:37-849(+)